MDHLPAGAEPLQPDGEEEQLLKGQPPPGQVQGLRALREVDVLIGVLDAAELMMLPHTVRQHVRQDVRAGVQPLADGPGQNQLADSGGKGIDGHDAAGDLPPPLRLHHRIGHLMPEEGALRPAIEDIGLSLVQAVFSHAWLKKVTSRVPVSSTARSFTRSSPLRMWEMVGGDATMAATPAVSPGTRSAMRRRAERSS